MVLQRSVEDIAKLVEVIEKVGPRNLSLVARLAGIPVETARYIVKVRLPRLGFRFRPVVNGKHLGLVMYFLKLSFSDKFRDLAPDVFDVLARRAYITYYAALLPHDYYIALASVPVTLEDKYRHLFELLADEGVLNLHDIYPLDDIWWTSADIRGFNIISGEWYAKLPRPSTYRSTRITRPARGKPMVDKIDLLIIKELQKDPLQPFTRMAETLGIKEHVLRYHYNEHVVNRRLIPRYQVVWSPREDLLEGNYIGLVLFYEGLDEEKFERINSILKIIPFSSLEGVSKTRMTCVAIVRIPSSWLVRVLRLIREEVTFRNATISIIDTLRMKRYTIPYELFDDRLGWTLEEEKVLGAIGRLTAAASKAI